MECFAFKSPSSGGGGRLLGVIFPSAHPSPVVTGSICFQSDGGRAGTHRIRVEGDGRHSFYQSSTFPRSRSPRRKEEPAPGSWGRACCQSVVLRDRSWVFVLPLSVLLFLYCSTPYLVILAHMANLKLLLFAKGKLDTSC